MKRAILAWFVLVVVLLSLPFVFAANDPGHDSLYVLRIGDTNITGSINLTGNVTASFVRFTSKAFGDYLDIVANGTVLAAPSTPRIMGATSSLYIDSTGNLYLNTKGGTTSTVQVGDTATNGVTLNVSGVIRQQNVLVCLANGTNCPGSLGSANITGSGSVGYLARWTSSSDLGTGVIYDDGTNVGIGTATTTQKLTITGGINASGTIYQANVAVCLSDGTNCPVSSSPTGWTNSSGSGNISLTNSAVNVSINTLFIDNTNGRVGIGTTSPTAKVQIAGQLNITAGNISVQSGNGVCLNEACTARIYYNGTATVIEGT